MSGASQLLEARVVDDRQHAVRAQAGLDRVDQQQGAVRLGQLARGGVELRRHRAARVAFAHHRLQEHRLDEPAMLVGVGERGFAAAPRRTARR